MKILTWTHDNCIFKFFIFFFFLSKNEDRRKKNKNSLCSLFLATALKPINPIIMKNLIWNKNFQIASLDQDPEEEEE